MEKAATYDFIAEPFRCDLNGELMYSTLGNYMLNAADYHSAERGFGWKALKAENKAWVLSRLAIEMQNMPQPYEHFHITTWMEKTLRAFTYRHWAITGENNRLCGYATSVWAMIDLTTRQPADIFKIGDGKIRDYADENRGVPIDRASHVKIDKENLELLRETDIAYSDIDINNHVNSIKYIEHVMNVCPEISRRSKQIRRLEVAYATESHMTDRLRFYGKEEGERFCCVVMRVADGVEQEAVRCNISYKL